MNVKQCNSLKTVSVKKVKASLISPNSDCSGKKESSSEVSIIAAAMAWEKDESEKEANCNCGTRKESNSFIIICNCTQACE